MGGGGGGSREAGKKSDLLIGRELSVFGRTVSMGNNIICPISHRTKHYRLPRWIGWAISIIIFSFLLIICAQPPFLDDHNASVAGSSGTRLSSSTRNKKATLTGAGDDVLVKCEIVTPYDFQNAATGTLDIIVHRRLAPLASNAFLDMVTSNHFDRNYIFRAVEGFVVQWGIESATNKNGKHANPKVGIDPPPPIGSALRSNVRGSLNFAGGNSSSGQVYVNRKTNSHLDKEPGSLPFATLDDDSMSIIDSIYSYKEGLGQVVAVKKGDAEVKRLFPHMSRIEKCWIAHASI